MRFFLDSNVLVSGAVFPGTERWILLSTFRGEHTFVLSEDVRRETVDVMQKKFPRLGKDMEESLSLLRAGTVPKKSYEERTRAILGLRDPRDAHILAAAIVSGCDAIVTGDRDLLELEEVESVKILPPRQARRLIAPSR